jgi:hypothetical protein
METQLYRLTKLASVKNPVFKSASSIDEYRNSEDFSPPVEYYVEGYPYTSPRINSSFVFVRNNRNGVKVNGVMTTSIINKIYLAEDGVGQMLETNNSVYILTKI